MKIFFQLLYYFLNMYWNFFTELGVQIYVYFLISQHFFLKFFKKNLNHLFISTLFFSHRKTRLSHI